MARPTVRDKANIGATAAAEFIERQIASGIWRPGDRLPTERELVEQFHVARNTLRKSLDRLELGGKITRQIGRGTFVAAPESKATNEDSLLQKIHGASPAEVMDLRLMIEPQAGELSAARATADDLAAMEDCLRRCEIASSIAEFEEWDGRLHQQIIVATRNQLLSDIYDAINGVRQSAEWGRLKARSLTNERRSLYQEQHRLIMKALRNRDPDLARHEIRSHLLSVRASFGGL
jgi:DNA-binding FadR family transcriptional regulator